VDPYRTQASDEVAEAPRDIGLVGDVIAQFADPMAFLRELVQNAIDAGSPSVEIRLHHELEILHVVVRDRGEGMSRDTLENQLLVLFRSTKERDHTKIGKFGIGFASVLAQNPNVVVVTTVRDGRRLVLHLERDLTYELFDAGAATQRGTSVELEIPMAADRVETFVYASVATLQRWCRHATVPIEVIAQLPGNPAPMKVKIDQPLGLPGALVATTGRSDGGELVAVVGLTSDPEPYAGFFNHGLTLYETHEPMFGRVAVKIQDSRLGHTLSRDNVRRDDAFERALVFARELIDSALPEAAEHELRVAAEAGDLKRHRTLLDAIVTSGLALNARRWHLPLVEPIAGRTSIEVGSLSSRTWASTQRTPLTALLAANGTPIVHIAATGRAWLAGILQEHGGVRLAEVDRELTSVTPVERSDADHAWLSILKEILTTVHRAPSCIELAHLAGACADELAIAGSAMNGSAYLVDRDQAGHKPFGVLRKPPLVLSADHPFVAAARAADPRLAASHLARAVLLQYQLLDVARSETILACTLDVFDVGRTP